MKYVRPPIHLLISICLFSCLKPRPPDITMASPSTGRISLNWDAVKRFKISTTETPPSLNCMAEQLAKRVEGTVSTLPDAVFLDAVAYCGPFGKLDTLSCKSGSLPEIDAWLNTLPTVQRTGRVGIGYARRPDNSGQLCLIRQDTPEPRLQIVGNETYLIIDFPGSGDFFSRSITKSNELREKRIQTTSRMETKTKLTSDIRAMEIHRSSTASISRLATWVQRSDKSLYQDQNIAGNASITSAKLLDQINEYRTARKISGLNLTEQWNGPLATALEKFASGKLPTIVGLLDSRGWSISRFDAFSATVRNHEEFQSLISYSPTLRQLVNDPYFNELGLGHTVDGKLLLLFVQSPSADDPQNLEDAIVHDLNRHRNRLGMPQIKKLASRRKVPHQNTCRIALATLLKLIGTTANPELWLKATVTKSNDVSTPTCQLSYALSSGDDT